MKGKISPKLEKLLSTPQGRDKLTEWIVEGKHRMARQDNVPWKKCGLTEAQYFRKKYLEELERHSKWQLALEDISTTNCTCPDCPGTTRMKQIAEEALK